MYLNKILIVKFTFFLKVFKKCPMSYKEPFKNQRYDTMMYI